MYYVYSERRRLVEAVLSRMTLLDAFNWRSCGHMELFLRTAENSKMDIPREHWEHLTKLAMVQINQINEESKVCCICTYINISMLFINDGYYADLFMSLHVTTEHK